MTLKELQLAISFENDIGKQRLIGSDPMVVGSWGFDEGDNDIDADELLSKPPWGVAIGCSDGFIYLFHPQITKVSKRQKSLKQTRRLSGEGLPPYRRAAHLSLTRSRNASPAASKTNLPLASAKSRAVSGLTRTDVEAPKNFVDFEDEQEKMKSMIAERHVRDIKDRRPSIAASSDVPSIRFDEAKSIPSTPSTSSLRSPPLSPPLSPALEPQRIVHSRKHLRMHTRITPRDFGYGHGIVSMEVLEEGELLLVLQESGTLDGISVCGVHPGDVVDGAGTTVIAHGSGSRILWTWCYCQVMLRGGSLYIVTVARADSRSTSLDSGHMDEKTWISVFELVDLASHLLGATRIVKRYETVIENRAQDISVHMNDDNSLLLYLLDSAGQLFSRLIMMPMRPEEVIPDNRRQPHVSSASRDMSLSLPQAFKELVSRSELPSPADETKRNSLDADNTSLLGKLTLASKIEGLRVHIFQERVKAVAWDSSELIIYDIEETSLSWCCTIPNEGILDLVWVDEDTVMIFCTTKVVTYRIFPNSNENPPEIIALTKLPTGPSQSLPYTKSLVERIAQQPLICVDTSSEVQRLTKVNHQPCKSQTGESQALVMWSSTCSTKAGTFPSGQLTALLPLELSSIICGYNTGELRRFSLADLVREEWQSVPYKRTMRTFSILSLFPAKNLRTGEEYVIGGGDDGSISIWDIKHLKLRARWIIFMEPLKQIIELEADAAGRLRGCCLAISGGGTIAVITTDGFSLLFVVPGSPSPLRVICMNTDNLLLFYADNRTRLWDVKTHEFRRSMSSEKAREMLGQGNWIINHIQDSLDETSGLATGAVLNRGRADGQPAPALLVNADNVNGVSLPVLNQSEAKPLKHSLHQALFSILHTSGIDEHIESVFADYVGAMATRRTARVNVYDSERNLQTYYADSAHAAWQISSEVTTLRLLCLMTILKAESNSRVSESFVETLSLFYSSALPMAVGPLYRPPALATLAHYRNESRVTEVRAAALRLFECELARLSDDEISSTVEIWRHTLPCLVPEAEKQSNRAALSLSLCGNIAIEKYNLLSSTTLSDIAKSITIYLYDEKSPHRTLAIELCSRGFETWQQYFDAMEALRSLFTLATTSRKDSISVRNPGPHARMAVLQIAESNSPLFVTTLSLDILHPRSIEYSKSIMQIIAFLIKMKPLVLYPNLPRLMEAVVKSLDPGSNADREAVLDTVTEIIALVVQTFPIVDFHAGSQRLAVGTSEGAVIMYDLKTATRLYVLEGHRKRLSGLSFSPDGRRMVTISLEESIALVWKVGSSFVSFFHPGVPPRQGRSGSEPFKTLNFVLKDEAKISVEGSLKQVRFSWPTDRSVKVDVADTTFTFST